MEKGYKSIWAALERLVKYPIIKVGENPINTLVLCSRCHMIIDLKQMSSGKEQKKIGQKIMGQKNFFLSVNVFFVCSDKSLLICVFSYNTYLTTALPV